MFSRKICILKLKTVRNLLSLACSCLTTPRIARTPQDLPPQNKWASSCQPEDTKTKLNFLYDDLHFGRDEADLEADPVLCEIHWFRIRHMEFQAEKYWELRIFYWEMCGLTAILLSAYMVSQASIPSVDKVNEPESTVELESMDKKDNPVGKWKTVNLNQWWRFTGVRVSEACRAVICRGVWGGDGQWEVEKGTA